MGSTPARGNSRPNRLALEKSPYLLEHAYNPVDWYPWGLEAFERARREDKPIFLSIGYSACHWCHVFRTESLENQEIAELLNSNFVSIKVDREERPDVDELYMKAVTSLTGSGGWPLNVFLTPSLEPIYGGTYFPPVATGGLPSFRMVLDAVSRGWKSDRANLVRSASEIKQALNELYQNQESANTTLDNSLWDACFSELAAAFDEKYGGFGRAPKFPMPSNLFFLLRYHKKTGSNAPLLMVRKTLDQMARGGINDQLAGGFHRYSTDQQWLIPHFEKMLYDTALLSWAYTECYLVTRVSFYRKVATESLDWILREMHSPGGGFYSAQDADTPDGEGAYYVCDPSDVRSALSVDPDLKENLEVNVALACKHFGITPQGNYEGKSVLTLAEDASKISQELSIGEEKTKRMIERCRVAMSGFRATRPKPLIDDKILTSWNGLAISALSKAYQVFERDSYLSAAKAAASFIMQNLTQEEEKSGMLHLLHRYREGEAKVTGLLEDYAYFGNSMIDLYEADFDPFFLKTALKIVDTMVADFYDEKNGGFFSTKVGAQDLIIRTKEAFDGALPAPNSLAVLALLRLAEITESESLRKKAKASLEALQPKMESQPSAFTFMISNLAFALDSPKQIVISSAENDILYQSLLRALRSQFIPNAITLKATAETEAISPAVLGRTPAAGSTAKVYVCRNKVCLLPASSPEELSQALTM